MNMLQLKSKWKWLSGLILAVACSLHMFPPSCNSDLRRKKPTPVYVAAGCGAINVRWLMYFLNRAADLRLAAALFSVHHSPSALFFFYRMKTLWCCHGCHVPNPCFLIFDALTKSLQNHPDLDSNSQQSYALVSSIWPQARHRCCRNVAFTYFCQLNLSDSRMCCAHWLLRKFQELVPQFCGEC